MTTLITLSQWVCREVAEDYRRRVERRWAVTGEVVRVRVGRWPVVTNVLVPTLMVSISS